MDDGGPADTEATDFAVDAKEALKDWMEPVIFSRKEVSNFRNIPRDFSDGVCVAEVLKYYVPKLIDIHNYHRASSSQQKIDNWKTLNSKVLSKLEVAVPMDVVQKIVAYKPGVMLMVLSNIKVKVEQYLKPKIPRPEGEPQHTKEQKQAKKKAVRAKPGLSGRKGNSGRNPEKRDGDEPGHERAATGVAHGGDDAGISGDFDFSMMKKCLADYDEVNAMLLSKVKKLEALMKLKDKRILVLERKCTENGVKI